MSSSDTQWAADAARAASGLPPGQQRDFRRLARELQAHRGRWGLFVLEYGHARSREQLAAAIEQLVPGARRLAADNTLHPDWPALEEALVNAAQGAPLVQLMGLERWLDAYDSKGRAEARLRAWNIRREAFSQAVPVPVLCWMRAPQVELLATVAPDLWSWRTGVHWFEDEAAKEKGRKLGLPLFPKHSGQEMDVRADERRLSRIAELARHLESNTETSLLLRALLLNELAGLHASIGELEKAFNIRTHQLLPLIEQLGDEHMRAVIFGQIADILQNQGTWDEALRIRREEELPVYEKLGDLRSRAVALGQIADLLQARGQLDEALRIRREEELHAYEKLGDVRERAVTLGRIADVLQIKGELDEAARIRREEEMPIYERLGDMRMLLMARTALATCLAQRGRQEDRPEILKLLHQAFATAQQLQLPEARTISSIYQDIFGTPLLNETVESTPPQETGPSIQQR